MTCLTMIYLIIFGESTAQFVGSFYGKRINEVWYSSKTFYIVMIGVLMVPLILRKQIAELKGLASLLFGAIGIFVFITFFLLTLDTRFSRPL